MAVDLSVMTDLLLRFSCMQAEPEACLLMGGKVRLSMRQNRKYAQKNLVSTILYQIVVIAAGLILPRLVVTGYGSEINGLLNSINQFLLYFSLLEAGLHAATKQALYGPVARGDQAAINSVISAAYRSYQKVGWTYFACLIALSFVYPWVARSSLNYWIVAGTVFLSGFPTVILFFVQGKYTVLLQVEGKMYVLMHVSTIMKIIINIAKVVMIYFLVDVIVIRGISALLDMVYVIYIVCYVKKNYKWLDLKAPPDYEAIGQRNYVIGHQVADMIYQNTDVFLLTIFCDLRVVSVYSMYKLIITNLEGILLSGAKSVSFALGQTYQVDRELYKTRIDVFESVYGIVSTTFLSTALHLILPFMVLYTEGVTDAEYCDIRLAILFVAIAWLTAVRLPMKYTIEFAGHFKATVGRAIAEAVINLTVSVVGVIFWGIYGVLLGSVVAVLYRSLDMIVYTNKKLLDRTVWKTLSIHLIDLVVLISSQFALRQIPITVDSYGTFALVGLLDCVVLAVLLMGVHSLCFPEFRMWIAEELKRLVKRKGRSRA